MLRIEMHIRFNLWDELICTYQNPWLPRRAVTKYRVYVICALTRITNKQTQE